MTLYIAQTKYIMLTERVNNALWLKGMIGELDIMQDCVTIHFDNQSVIHLVYRQIYYKRAKHIIIILYFVRDIIEAREVRIKKIDSEENSTHVFTKSLSKLRFKLWLK